MDVLSTLAVWATRVAVLHATHQLAQPSTVVHRSQQWRRYAGHRRFRVKSPSANRLQLVHQTQNGGLVGVIDALGFLLLTLWRLCCASAVFGGYGCPAAGTRDRKKLQINRKALPEPGKQRTDRRPHPFGRTVWSGGFPAGDAVVRYRHDRGLRFTGRHQTLQIAQNGTGWQRLSAHTTSQGLRCFAFGVLGRSQTQLRLPSNMPCAISLERIQVFAQQEHSLGLTPSMVRNGSPIYRYAGSSPAGLQDISRAKWGVFAAASGTKPFQQFQQVWGRLAVMVQGQPTWVRIFAAPSPPGISLPITGMTVQFQACRARPGQARPARHLRHQARMLRANTPELSTSRPGTPGCPPALA